MDMHSLIADGHTAADYASLRRRVAEGNGDAVSALQELATTVRRDIVTTIDRAVALYSTLARCGFFSPDELATFAQPLSPLNGHPNRTKVPGVETNTGPLGHGLPVAVGCALGAKMDGAAWRTYVLTGDGELQEGSNWEAALSAAHYKLDNLTVIVDRNRLQQGDWTEQTMHLEPLADKWRAFGWSVAEVDGHHIGQLLDTFS